MNEGCAVRSGVALALAGATQAAIHEFNGGSRRGPQNGTQEICGRWFLNKICLVETVVEKRFKIGDHVSWNSEAGHVSGTIIGIHTKDVDYKGHTRRCSKDEPQYEIKSDKTDHIAMHKGAALSKISG
jgi:DUF2945 family protein